MIWLAVSFDMARRIGARPSGLGLGTGQARTAARLTAVVALPALVVFTAAHLALHGFHPVKSFTDVVIQVPVQLLAVAFPEEIFFRGYLQSRLTAALPSGPRYLGVGLGVPLVLPAFLFAAAHFFMDPAPARLATFFPGLLFGYLRERTGAVWAGVAVHAAANVVVFALEGQL
ncbi:MAG: myxosortase family intramembrane protease [Deltaproteobacteria bacterium]|nr:myxosortase family intramembrane protease [Deltaproteobacteria bacterium]